ncbi:class I SAM-dependent methyltransferase [Gelidibacter mesophilus]|uniref:class I SAM-dependent methyltransferase n=1 Tax=Gelidibacter mesophilus TaxID=169050 RepID=UPI0004271321|nr:class I SAM-dependent methyltransferase [Gelidibacter mesophilus]
MNTREHWETVYENKSPDQVSWTQEKPEISLQLIKESHLPKTAKIIDIGGGDSKLVDYLLKEGYTDITVLDISAKALEKAKTRLGKEADKVKWIVSDVTQFKPIVTYDLWHDRAAFHFLTSKDHVEMYTAITNKFVMERLIIGTFSIQGPTRCSGLDISQYDENTLAEVFQTHFKQTKCLITDHITPFETIQNFQFCSFKKLK